MRKNIVTACMISSIFAVATVPAFAGGVGEPEIEPEVFSTTDEVAAGSLSGSSGLIILGVLVAGVLVAGDSN